MKIVIIINEKGEISIYTPDDVERDALFIEPVEPKEDKDSDDKPIVH